MNNSDKSMKRVGILRAGDTVRSDAVTIGQTRFSDVFAALAAAGIEAVPVVYAEAEIERIRIELSALDGVLVWVNPIHEGRNRRALDALLREAAGNGLWVSAHPDVIGKMGTKEVLYRTRSMGWGSDTAFYSSRASLYAELPLRLAAGPRVIKRNRGNGGIGVFKVEIASGAGVQAVLRVLDATGDTPDLVSFDEFVSRCENFLDDGGIIDQAFQPRLTEGVVRCYSAGDRCAGFGYQKVRALVDSESDRAQAGPRNYTPDTDPRFQHLRRHMESVWIPEMARLLEISHHDLPAIWDADFMLGPRGPDGADTYVLGEINVSSVHPFPREAPAKIALWVVDRLKDRKG